MGRRRTPSGPVSSTTAFSAKRLEAESAEVTPLLTLPPMVPTFLIWGEPTWSTAQQRMGMRDCRALLLVISEKVAAPPMTMVPSSSIRMPVSSGSWLMLTRLHPASFPSRVWISTSVPPEISMASGSASSARTASGTSFAR